MNWIKYIITIPFALCVLFLQGLGKCFRLTYKQISVIFNLWIQGGVLVLSALLPFVAYVSKCCFSHDSISGWNLVVVWILFFILLGYALIYVWLYVLMIRHYGKSFDLAFDRCVSDLLRLAHVWHCSYQCVNLIIFVGIFSLLVGFHLFMASLIIMMPL